VATKQEALELIESLPDGCSWDDIIYELYVKKKIDKGLKAADEGRVKDHDEVRKRFSE
jgi:hypothetical protein